MGIFMLKNFSAIMQDFDKFLEDLNYNEKICELKLETTENKIAFLRQCLLRTNIININIIFNISLLVKAISYFDGNLFKNKDVIFKDIMEFIDIKYLMKEDIELLAKRLFDIFLNSLASYNNFNEEQSVDSSNLYYLLLNIMNFNDICNIISITKEDNKMLRGSKILINNIAKNTNYAK